MPDNQKPQSNLAATWTGREAYLLALVCLVSGLVLGYLFRGSAGTIPTSRETASLTAAGAASPALPPNDAPAGGVPLHSAEALRPLAAPMLAALKANPGDVRTLVELGNLYYDHHVYPEAIASYGRALELAPDDVNVRTDLGTAYWYSGSPQEALAEYEKALKLQPGYAPTLLNLGIVRLEGLKDPAGAIAAWERLLKVNPQYPEKQRVLDLIGQAKRMRG